MTLLGFSLAVSTGCGSSGGPRDAAPDVEGADEGFADIAITTFDGGSFRLRDFRGKPIVVNFFASWCAPCVREMPEIEAVKTDLADEIAVVGVNVMDDPDKAERLVADTGITWTLGRDTDGSLLRAVGGQAMPTTLVIDADGVIVAARTGGITQAELLDLLAPILEREADE